MVMSVQNKKINSKYSLSLGVKVSGMSDETLKSLLEARDQKEKIPFENLIYTSKKKINIKSKKITNYLY